MHEFNQSLKYDQRMHSADIRGSIAYAKALKLVGILTEEEQVKITEGLTAVEKEWENGSVSPLQSGPAISSDLTSASSRSKKMTRISTRPTRGD